MPEDPAEPIHRADVLAQLALALLCAAGMAWLQTRYVPGYDENWHLLFAEMQPWTGFLAEIRADSHPPLSSCLFRLLTEPGAAPFAARSLSILAAALSPLLAFVTARGLGLRRPVAHLAALLLATSLLHITLGIVIRGYALAHLLTWGFLAVWVRVVPGPGLIPASRRRLAILCAILATATLWSAGLVAAAAAMALAWVVIRRPGPRANWRQALATPALRLELALVALGMFAVAGLWAAMAPASSFSHLDVWVRQPAETVAAFCARGFTGVMRALLGAPELPESIALAAGTLLLVTGFAASRSSAARRAAALLLLLLIASLALLGITGLHPFGGAERQMSILLAPALLVFVTAVQAVAARLRSPLLRRLLWVGVLLCAAGNTTRSLAAGRLPDDLSHEAPVVAAFESLRPRLQPGDALWAHGFSRIPFYAASRGEGAWVRRPLVDAAGQRLIRYRVQFAAETRDLFYDRRWLAPAGPDSAWLAELAALVEREPGHGLWALRLDQDPPAPANADAQLARWHLQAARGGLVVADFVLLPAGEAVRLQRR